MVHGYHARWVALYNKRSTPTFSVGEYDWDKQAEQRGWIWCTATTSNLLNFRWVVLHESVTEP